MPVPWVVAGSQLLLGLAYGATLVATVDFADRHAPEGMRTTSQALMSSLVSGLGRSVGSGTAGTLYDALGPQPTFGVYALLCLVATAAFGGVWRRELFRGARRRGQ